MAIIRQVLCSFSDDCCKKNEISARFLWVKQSLTGIYVIHEVRNAVLLFHSLLVGLGQTGWFLPVTFGAEEDRSFTVTTESYF